MRTKTFTREDTGDTRAIDIRALKKKEIRDLKEYGYGSLMFLPERGTADEAVDKALETVLSAEDLGFLEECGNQEFNRAWHHLIKETYGDKDEEKNLSATSGGDGTDSGSNTAGSAAAEQ